MRLYAVRDRLIDYFMTPFVAQNDHIVMANIADTINQVDGKHGIQQAPQHYEIWILADITEDGHIDGAARGFLADCGTLVRPGRDAAGPGAGQAERPLAQRKEPPRGARAVGHPEAGAVPEPVRPTPVSVETGTGESAGSDPGDPPDEVHTITSLEGLSKAERVARMRRRADELERDS